MPHHFSEQMIAQDIHPVRLPYWDFSPRLFTTPQGLKSLLNDHPDTSSWRYYISNLPDFQLNLLEQDLLRYSEWKNESHWQTKDFYQNLLQPARNEILSFSLYCFWLISHNEFILKRLISSARPHVFYLLL